METYIPALSAYVKQQKQQQKQQQQQQQHQQQQQQQQQSDAVSAQPAHIPSRHRLQ
jgi:hypothetical protein